MQYPYRIELGTGVGHDLLEVVQDGGGKLSIILAGHPKLQNDLKSPEMEEVGYRTWTISLTTACRASSGNLSGGF